MDDKLPLLFVCHGDDGGPRFHPCRRVQEALRAAGIEYTKIIAGHGSPFPWLRGPRPELLRMTGTNKLPTLKLPDGTILIHPRAIYSWIETTTAKRSRVKRREIPPPFGSKANKGSSSVVCGSAPGVSTAR
jgi:Glutathione S-transferase, N-terminal domain